MSNNPKCPVFGCTIPCGIPHEHPAGVSAVMRDPAEPLNSGELAELEGYRRNALQLWNNWAANQQSPMSTESNNGMANMNSFGMAEYQARESIRLQTQQSGTFAVPRNVPGPVGRKLRDSLLMAGHVGTSEHRDMQAKRNEELSSLLDSAESFSVSGCPEVRRLSVVQIAGRIAAGIAIAVGAASIIVLSAMNAGWL